MSGRALLVASCLLAGCGAPDGTAPRAVSRPAAPAAPPMLLPLPASQPPAAPAPLLFAPATAAAAPTIACPPEPASAWWDLRVARRIDDGLEPIRLLVSLEVKSGAQGTYLVPDRDDDLMIGLALEPRERDPLTRYGRLRAERAQQIAVSCPSDALSCRGAADWKALSAGMTIAREINVSRVFDLEHGGWLLVTRLVPATADGARRVNLVKACRAIRVPGDGEDRIVKVRGGGTFLCDRPRPLRFDDD